MSALSEADDLAELWERFLSTHDPDLRNTLVLHYSPLVKYVAGRMRSRMPGSVESNDLVSDGIFGLIEALGRFDPARGVSFQTFAVPRIRGAILDGLRSLDILPRSVRAIVTQVQAAQVTLEHRLGRTPEDEELAAETGMTLRALRSLYSKLAVDKQSTLDSVDLVDEFASAVTSGAADREVNESLLLAIEKLSERDRIIIALYYFEGLTMAQIGQVLGVSQPRVSQAHSRATLMLRTHLASMEVD